MFVWVVLLAFLLLGGALCRVFQLSPPFWVLGIGVLGVWAGAHLLALYLFNKPGPSWIGGRDNRKYIQELEGKGLIATTDYSARRAFGMEEFNEEGPSYYIELNDDSVLHLGGQYLYGYEPIDDDPELNRPRQFPCAEFSVRRHRVKGFVIEIVCRGGVVEPELTAPHYSREEFASGAIPKDGEIIRDRSYDQLKLLRTAKR